jgi:Zn-dependent alcohol dehydrogenase
MISSGFGTIAAVLFETGASLVVQEVDLDPPGADEVLVRIEASGVCHSDWNAVTGTSPTPLPAVLGHEGAGVIEEIGPGVTGLAVGDRVVLSWLPTCGHCRPCLRGRNSLCETATLQMGAGRLPSGGIRLSHGGEPIHHYSYLSTFARHAVVSSKSCIRLQQGDDFAVAALVGCAVMTGIGAVINRAQVEPGSSVAVFGAGGVGLSAIMGARLAGAATIIAVEPVESKRRLALELGATVAIDGGADDVAEAVRDHSGGGVDYAFEAAGLTRLTELAFAVTRPGGMIVAVGIPPTGATVAVPAQELVRQEKVVTGTFYGSAQPSLDMPMILDLHAQGRLPLDRLVTRRYPLEDVNTAFEDMSSGVVARGVLQPWGGEPTVR